MRMNEVSSVGTDLDFMSCYSMKKDFDHFRGYEKIWSMEEFVHFKGGSTL